MRSNNEVEYRKMSLIEPQISKRSESDYIVCGYATTFEPYILFERDGVKIYEQIDRNAFQNADMSNVIMQYNHEGRVLARQSNGTLNLEVDNRGLYVTADLSGSTVARELYEDIKAGLVNKMSWTFIVGDEMYDKENRTRHIKSVRTVYEVGAVAIPANDKTIIGAASYFDELVKNQRQKQVLRMKHTIAMLDL